MRRRSCCRWARSDWSRTKPQLSSKHRRSDFNTLCVDTGPLFKYCTVNTAFILHHSNSLYRFSQCFAMDIMRHKDAVDDIVKTGKSIMNSKSPEEKEILKVD